MNTVAIWLVVLALGISLIAWAARTIGSFMTTPPVMLAKVGGMAVIS